MTEYSEDWFSKNIPIWEVCLSNFKGVQIEAIEIGSFEGRSTVWLMENILTHPDSHITCVDTFDGGTDLTNTPDFWEKVKNRFLSNTDPFKDKIELVVGDSAQYLKKREKRADFIYVDGSHYAANALIDGVLSHMLLKPHGIIIFDDYLWDKANKYFDVPKGAIDSFLDCFSREYDILSIGYQVVLQKK